MLIAEMALGECQQFLARTGFGRLGCAHNNEPYVVPIYFVYENDRLYGFSTFGRKIEWMRENPRVCVEVDEIATHSSWVSVILYGRYQELPDTPEYSSERHHAYELFEKRTHWWEIAHSVRGHKPAPSIYYRIDIVNMTGQWAAPNPIKPDRP
ncbi:MAG: pyridoxamine 5'-phosphate oxidase family protein [Candidatus Acidiferrum sp.]